MPLYEYRCKECDRESELLVRSLDSKPECPECGSARMEKLLSVIGAPVVGASAKPRESDPGACGRSQCARGCMFGN
ncbi:MAG: FmdB family zinc ribbon protein [Pirellula sp.]